jgi:hypothetical protein
MEIRNIWKNFKIYCKKCRKGSEMKTVCETLILILQNDMLWHTNILLFKDFYLYLVPESSIHMYCLVQYSFKEEKNIASKSINIATPRAMQHQQSMCVLGQAQNRL